MFLWGFLVLITGLAIWIAQKSCDFPALLSVLYSQPLAWSKEKEKGKKTENEDKHKKVKMNREKGKGGPSKGNSSTGTCSTIRGMLSFDSLNKQIFTEHQLHVRHCARHWTYGG